MSGSKPEIIVHDLGANVVRWTLSNPSRRNAVDPTMLHWLARTAPTLTGQIVVLTGAGSEAFCAGFDLHALEHPSETELPDAPLCSATRAMTRADATFVAVLNGYAIGAGVELACACDLRIARNDAWLQVPAGRLGVVYHADGLARLHAALGATSTRRLMLLGERLEAHEAHAAGAFVRCVQPDQLEEATQEVVHALQASTPLALRGHRDLLRRLDARPLAAIDRDAHDRARIEAYRAKRNGPRSD